MRLIDEIEPTLDPIKSCFYPVDPSIDACNRDVDLSQP
jgi:hypothetical protein